MNQNIIQAGVPDSGQPAQPAATSTSLDRAQSASWRFVDAYGFVIKDYTGLNAGMDPVIFVVKPDEVLQVVAEAAQQQKKITVFPIGPCVLDLS